VGKTFSLASLYHRCQRFCSLNWFFDKRSAKGRLVGISPLLMQNLGAKIVEICEKTKETHLILSVFVFFNRKLSCLSRYNYYFCNA